MHRLLETFTRTELLDQLHGRAHGVQRRYAQDECIVQVQDAFVLVLGQEAFQHGACLWAILTEHIALAHIVGAFLPGQWLAVEGNVADEVEGVEVFAEFFGDVTKCCLLYTSPSPRD